MFLCGLFPTRASLPDVIFFDNNCHFVEMIDNMPHARKYFEAVAFPVDVFHFKSHSPKHKICAERCNPYSWPDLLKEDGSWRFNSSASEQTNIWYGGFQSIVREMPSIRYNFVLDEVVNVRNAIRHEQLERDGAQPYLIPRHELLQTNGT